MRGLLAASRALRDGCEELRREGFESHVTHVYDPLDYAWSVHEAFLRRFGADHPREALLVGMNPGPWGMVQTGVPFSDPRIVKEWFGLDPGLEVRAPREPGYLHPKRPIEGLQSERDERSGGRLFSMARDAFGGFDAFFERFWVHNYCPLAFFDEEGGNVTPPRLWKADRQRLFDVCDPGLARVVEHLDPGVVVGVGKFAERRARAALADDDVPVGGILHPSPASPKANRGWQRQALQGLAKLGIEP